MRAGAIILAGGRSTRMGRSKASLELDGRTLLARVVDAVTTRCARVVVVRAPGAELPPIPVEILVVDDLPGLGGGPLVGLVAGLVALGEGVEVAYVSSCDAALLSPVHVAFMLDALASDPSLDAVVPEEGGFLHPLAGAVRVTPARPAADALLREGSRSAGALYRRLGATTVPPEALPEPDVLRPCNTPEDWERILGAARRSD